MNQNPILAAVAAFLAVSLGVVSVVLLWEGVRSLLRQRQISSELRKLAGPEAAAPTSGGLLRDRGGEGGGWLDGLLLHVPHRHDLAHFLGQADVGWSVTTFTLFTIGAGVAFGLALLIAIGGWLAPLFASTVGALIPYFFASRARKKRFAQFEEHFPDSIDLLGRAIRAGHAFSTGLKVVSEESPEPVSDEFRQVYEEQKFGLPLSESLLSLADRVALLDVRIFVTAVLIQVESGGNLAEILDNLSHIIRERFRFRRQLRTHTAHGRMTGLVLAGAPIVAAMGMYIVNPAYMSVLFTEPLGRLMLMMAAGLQLLGFIFIRRIMDVEL